MNLQKDLKRFKLANRLQNAFLVLQVEVVYAVTVYPESWHPTCVLFTDKGESFEVEGTEEEIYKLLGWLRE